MFVVEAFGGDYPCAGAVFAHGTCGRFPHFFRDSGAYVWARAHAAVVAENRGNDRDRPLANPADA